MRLFKRTERTPFESLVHWVKILAGGAFIALGALVAMGVVVYNVEQSQDRQQEREVKEALAKEQQALLGRQIEACFNYNNDQTNDRHTAIDGLKEFAITFLDVSPEEADERLASPEGRHFIKFINEQNPYRQCSEACVIAQTAPDATKCEPAINEQGDAA